MTDKQLSEQEAKAHEEFDAYLAWRMEQAMRAVNEVGAIRIRTSMTYGICRK